MHSCTCFRHVPPLEVSYIQSLHIMLILKRKPRDLAILALSWSVITLFLLSGCAHEPVCQFRCQLCQDVELECVVPALPGTP